MLIALNTDPGLTSLVGAHQSVLWHLCDDAESKEHPLITSAVTAVKADIVHTKCVCNIM